MRKPGRPPPVNLSSSKPASLPNSPANQQTGRPRAGLRHFPPRPGVSVPRVASWSWALYLLDEACPPGTPSDVTLAVAELRRACAGPLHRLWETGNGRRGRETGDIENPGIKSEVLHEKRLIISPSAASTQQAACESRLRPLFLLSPFRLHISNLVFASPTPQAFRRAEAGLSKLA